MEPRKTGEAGEMADIPNNLTVTTPGPHRALFTLPGAVWRRVAGLGVEVMAWQADVTVEGVTLARELPVRL